MVYDEFLIFRIINFLTYFKNGLRKRRSTFGNNYFTKKYLKYDEKRSNLLRNKISKSDLVLLVMQLHSNFAEEIIEFCQKENIPCVFRTTGNINGEVFECKHFKKISRFIHHSNRTANKLFNLKVPYSIIDQASLQEEQLLKLKLKKERNLRFGFLGRFTKEKGALELSEFFGSRDEQFFIAGDGPLKNEILKNIKTNPNSTYLGAVAQDKLESFFAKIDVLIISSYEEAGPYTGLEAMAAGKIIISTRVGAMEDRLEGTNNDFWFNINEISTLDSAIRKLKSEETTALENISCNLRKKIIENYSNQKIGELYLNEITQLIQKTERLSNTFNNQS
ncbi:glycosyltransferase [Salegentibacter sp. Hel_I_6]|uniref:glycosyltransferase n=1 Tax=Salegentibacter sp. Hel_I_6 TaxID=1250278 RepID=UPI0005668D6E|nr:glycosyltransferase [Salegentibacter sp. Hel_I_6]